MKICLHCGMPMKRQYEEYQEYYECNCPDANHNRAIRAQIEELKRCLKQPKFEIVTERIIRRIKNQ